MKGCYVKRVVKIVGIRGGSDGGGLSPSHAACCPVVTTLLVHLQPLVWLSILAQTLSSLVSLAWVGVRAAGRATPCCILLATPLASLDRVNLAMGEGVLLCSLVDLTVLAETAML